MCAYYKRRYPGGSETAKDLTVSGVERQNILHNPYALKEIRSNVGIHTINFKGTAVLTMEQVAEFYVFRAFLNLGMLVVESEKARVLRQMILDMGKFKYPLYTDKIYVSFFKENSRKYRRILRLHEKEM
ncbi:MAG TPA: hypothetical protein VJ967_08470 [Clostridia bacterium]|nr:hypothetical protein [Clostridia bacterium]